MNSGTSQVSSSLYEEYKALAEKYKWNRRNYIYAKATMDLSYKDLDWPILRTDSDYSTYVSNLQTKFYLSDQATEHLKLYAPLVLHDANRREEPVYLGPEMKRKLQDLVDSYGLPPHETYDVVSAPFQDDCNEEVEKPYKKRKQCDDVIDLTEEL